MAMQSTPRRDGYKQAATARCLIAASRIAQHIRDSTVELEGEMVNDLKGRHILGVLVTLGGKPQQFSEGKEERLKSSRAQKQRCELKRLLYPICSRS
jgi:hypothetical protein